jgi:hypothetical protein
MRPFFVIRDSQIVIPAKAGLQTDSGPGGCAGWIPAFAGMTREGSLA